ncbi:MAG: hypothetical protein KDK36_12285 [Leptospiraceae bacterium]|nr:hypothetical protein [Leptospiraceae bacterium]
MNTKKDVWLYNKYFEIIFIISPPFLASLGVYFFKDYFFTFEDIPLVYWIIFVLLIDVAHVYSTLFRTYFHSIEFNENKELYLFIPLLVWITGMVLYSIGAGFFWTIMAYIAVFHFMRQQYGFLRLYSRYEDKDNFTNKLDNLLLYLSILYPVAYWHTNLPRKFNWFIENDFLVGLPPYFEVTFKYAYLLTLSIFILKESINFIKKKPINLPKYFILSGTAISWFIGIVLYNNDLIFTITNVVTHGIPYIALIWIYGKKEIHTNNNLKVFGKINYRFFFNKYGILIFLGTLIIFAYIEESIWANFVWKEYLEIFPNLTFFKTNISEKTLTILVPLLSVPQVTHYILDGFIWKIRSDESYWKKLFFIN